jgi:hypothetical protein
MSVSVDSLIDQVLEQTDRVSDPTLPRAEVAQYLSDGAKSLYDIFLDAFPHWFQSSFDFTLAGDTAATCFTAVPDDFQVDLGLDWLNPPGFIGPLTIRRLPTFLDRNKYVYGAVLVPGSAFYSRQYEVQDTNIRLYPYSQSSGQYRLWYQKQILDLAVPDTRTFAVNASDITQPFGWTFNNANFVAGEVGSVLTPSFTQVTRSFAIDAADTTAGGIGWAMSNANFTAGDVGGTITPNFAAPNTAFNVAWTIASVLSPTTITTVPATGTFGAFTSPPSGTASIAALSNSVFNVPYTITAVLSGQQIEVTPDPESLGTFQTPPTGTVAVATPAPGTRADLPQVLTPWQLYLKTFASISVRIKYEEGVGELQARLDREMARAVRMSEKRDSDLRQVPIIAGGPFGQGIDSPNFDSGVYGDGGW